MAKLYMAVTADKYELPIYVEDRMVSLAKKLGRKPDSVSSCLTRGCLCAADDKQIVKIVTVEV